MFEQRATLVPQFDGVRPKMDGLLIKLRFINATIMELPTSMQDAHNKLADALAQMVSGGLRTQGPPWQPLSSFGARQLMHVTVSLPQDAAMATSPSPRDVASNLTAFSLPDWTPINDLIDTLETAETALYAAFPVADTTTYLDWIATTR